MPTIDFDISDEVANLIDTAIKSGGKSDFNPGQQAAWSNVRCEINEAVTSIYIAGTNVDVKTKISVSCTGAEYISEAVGELEQLSSEVLAQSIDNSHSYSWLTSQLIDEAFRLLW